MGIKDTLRQRLFTSGPQTPEQLNIQSYPASRLVSPSQALCPLLLTIAAQLMNDFLSQSEHDTSANRPLPFRVTTLIKGQTSGVPLKCFLLGCSIADTSTGPV